MKNKRNQRWRLCADGKLQGMLCLRVAAYWMICQLSMLGTVLVFVSLHESSPGAVSIWSFITPAIIISSLVLPIVLLDLLVFSNRIAGPLLNFRRKLQTMVETENIVEVKFRRGDFFHDLSDDFNKLCKTKMDINPRPEQRIPKETIV